MSQPVFAELTGQDAVVGQLSRAAAAASSLLAGERPDPCHDARVAVHRAARVGAFGRGAGLRRRAAVPGRGCGQCASCRQVQAGTHADLLLVRPEGLSYGVRQTRDLVLRAAGAPAGGRWRVVVFEDADRCTEQAANALLKAIEEPTPRTVWLLCAPSAEDLVRRSDHAAGLSRCRAGVGCGG